METLQCPSCAAAVEVEASGSATCPYCGTQASLRMREGVVDREIPSPEVLPDAPPPDLPLDKWRFEQWIGALLREADAGRRLEIVEAVPPCGREHLVWAPALADLMVGADRGLDLALGKALGDLARRGGTAARGQVLRVVRARLDRLQRSQGLIAALEGVGMPGLKTLLELADRAELRGDKKRVKEVLQPIWKIVDASTDRMAAACMEVLLALLPTAGTAVRRFLVHYVADCVDSRYEVALPGPREYHDFRFLVPMVVRFIDEQAGYNPELVAELVDEIDRLHTFHSASLRDAEDWSRATQQAVSEAGREAVLALVSRLYPPDSPFAREEPSKASLGAAEVTGEVVAEVIDGRARCPACGAPVPIRGTESLVTCERCARPVRIPAGVRTELEGWSFKHEIEQWSEAELVAALRAEADVERRKAISGEIDSARTHGSRYVGLVDALVGQMIEDPDDRVVINLEGALRRMIKTGGDPFRDALLAAVRARPDARRQPRLTRCLKEYGLAGFGLLHSLAQQSFEEAESVPEATAHGAVAFQAVSEAVRKSGYADELIDPLLETVLAMPATYEDLGPWQMGEHAAQAVAQMFVVEEDDPGEEALRRTRRDGILRFLDERIDPSGTSYTCLAPRPGCALFSDLGGPTGLGRLVGFIESLWDSPSDRQDLRTRVEWVAHARTDEVRLLALCSIKERPPSTMDADVERAERVFTPLLDVPHLGPAASAALDVLRREPEAPEQEGQEERFPTTRPRLWWYAWKARLRGWLARR